MLKRPLPMKLQLFQDGVSQKLGKFQMSSVRYIERFLDSNFHFLDHFQLQAQVYTLTNITCFEILKTFGVPIDSAIICTQGSPQGVTQTTCSGDSGGPLMVQRNGTPCSNFVNAQLFSHVPISGKFVHVGLTSFGLSLECTNDTPTMFARTTSILDWISATVSSSKDIPEEPFIPLLYR